MLSFICRHMEPGCDSFHAGVWAAALPRGQRQRDTDHDHGLQVHCAASCVCRVQGVSKAWARSTNPTPDTPSACSDLSSFNLWDCCSAVIVWGHPVIFDKKSNRRAPNSLYFLHIFSRNPFCLWLRPFLAVAFFFSGTSKTIWDCLSFQKRVGLTLAGSWHCGVPLVLIAYVLYSHVLPQPRRACAVVCAAVGSQHWLALGFLPWSFQDYFMVPSPVQWEVQLWKWAVWN